MELITTPINMHQIKCRSSMQTTLEDDRNVPDTKPDIDTIIKSQGHIQLTDIRPSDGKVTLRGTLSFSLLYAGLDDIHPIHDLSGRLPFEDVINLEGVEPQDDVSCHFDLEDFQITTINSRKISIRAIVSYHCYVDTTKSAQAGTSIISESAARAGMENAVPIAGLYQHFKTLSQTQLSSQKKDIYRFKDEVTLPKGKPNIQTLLYYCIQPQNLQTRLVQDGIRLNGDAHVFLLYVPEDEERNIEYLDTELPIDSIIHCDDCQDGMIEDIEFIVQSQEMDVKTDEDGERRLLDLEMTLNMQMKFYEELSFQILDDAYSTACDLQLTKEPFSFEKLFTKTQNVLRLSDHIKMPESDDTILQICQSSGRIQIDEQSITADGIALEGILELHLLFLTDNDSSPLQSYKTVLPFTHTIEIKDIQPDFTYEIQADLNQLSVLLIDQTEAEAKAVIGLCAFVFEQGKQTVITAIKEQPLDLERLQKLPGIMGYIADKEESLWDIAKANCTTVDNIRALNNMTGDILHKGERILVMKQISMQ